MKEWEENYESITKESDLKKWVKILNEQSVISVDTETSSLKPSETDLVGISFSYAPNKGSRRCQRLRARLI